MLQIQCEDDRSRAAAAAAKAAEAEQRKVGAVVLQFLRVISNMYLCLEIHPRLSARPCCLILRSTTTETAACQPWGSARTCVPLMVTAFSISLTVPNSLWLWIRRMLLAPLRRRKPRLQVGGRAAQANAISKRMQLASECN
jgi:hypothetical protein